LALPDIFSQTSHLLTAIESFLKASLAALEAEKQGARLEDSATHQRLDHSQVKSDASDNSALFQTILGRRAADQLEGGEADNKTASPLHDNKGLVLRSLAYKWLQTRVRRELLFKTAGDSVLSLICQELLDVIARNAADQNRESNDSLEIQTVNFEFPWDPNGSGTA
jgi:hypothetical protein